VTWHHVALAVLGVATGIGGFLIPGANVFTTGAAWALIGGALGNATVGPALKHLLGAAAAKAPEPTADSPSK
jgi:hypothetical protein